MTKETHKHPSDYFQESGDLLGDIFKKANYLVTLNSIVVSAMELPLGEHCHVINLKQGRLILATDSAQWAMLIRFAIPALLEKLRKANHLHNITGITCKIIPVSVKHFRQKAQAPSLLSAKSARCIREVAEGIGYERLRIALEKLASRCR